MKTWTVYEHISPSGKVYVGITTNIKIRWGNCGYRYKTYNSIFKKAIDEYSWNNISHNIIAEGLGEHTAKNIEKDLIAFYKKSNKSYNVTDGGDGKLGLKCTDETRKKMSESAKLSQTKEHMLLMVKKSNESLKKILAAKENIKIAHRYNIGKHHSE